MTRHPSHVRERIVRERRFVEAAARIERTEAWGGARRAPASTGHQAKTIGRPPLLTHRGLGEQKRGAPNADRAPSKADHCQRRLVLRSREGALSPVVLPTRAKTQAS